MRHKLSSELCRRLGHKVGFKELRLEPKFLNRSLWSYTGYRDLKSLGSLRCTCTAWVVLIFKYFFATVQNSRYNGSNWDKIEPNPPPPPPPYWLAVLYSTLTKVFSVYASLSSHFHRPHLHHPPHLPIFPPPLSLQSPHIFPSLFPPNFPFHSLNFNLSPASRKVYGGKDEGVHKNGKKSVMINNLKRGRK